MEEDNRSASSGSISLFNEKGIYSLSKTIDKDK